MKVAVCLSGQPRNASQTFPYIYKNIIEPNDADVFMHMNFDSSNKYMEKGHRNNGNCIAEEDIDRKLIELYKPKRVLVEKQKIFQNPNINICEKRLNNSMSMNKTADRRGIRNHDVFCGYSMFYGIYKANELKELYSLENNFVYDYVIRIRYDFMPMEPLICSNYNSQFIHYLNIGQPDNIISDWFNMGSSQIMNCYSSMFLNFEYINSYTIFKKSLRKDTGNTCYDNTNCIYGPEHMIRDLMDLFHIQKNGLDFKARLS